MRPVTKKWLFLKISSFILIPLMTWFIINFVSFYDKNYQEIVKFLTTQPSNFLVSLFLIFAYFFSALSISEVFEDYIHDKKIKNAANKALNIFAILIPLMLWFVINFVSFYDKDYQEIVEFLTTQPSKFLVSLFLIFAFFFSALSISEVLEDYIHNKKIKNAANKALNIFAILIPLTAIIVIFNLSL